MKVLLIDPTGIAYGAELARSLTPLVDLTYVTRDNDVEKRDIKCSLKLWFKAPNRGGKIAWLIKGGSYVTAYIKALHYAKREKIDVIHIQWLSLPAVDGFFLNRLKATGAKMVFTAHNVLPHRNSESFLESYRQYYSIFDRIIVHGESIRQEFIELFPEFSEKLVIERHGIFDSLSTETDESKINSDVLQKVRRAKKVAIFFGNMFFNKGTDELVRKWLEDYKDNPDYYLFVVGKLDPNYSEMISLETQISNCSNIFYKPEIIEEIELNTYINLSDIVVMPYKHASMSGIIFKAAVMEKTVLTTNTGSIKEYINDNCAFCSDSFDNFFNLMDDIMMEYSREQLKLMGKNLGNHIRMEYSWNHIAESTIHDVYNGGLL